MSFLKNVKAQVFKREQKQMKQKHIRFLELDLEIGSPVYM